VALEASCILRLFAAGASPPPVSNHLSQEETDRLITPARARPPIERSTVTLQDTDCSLVQALAQDGRATYWQLAVRTHWHESAVRPRVEELIASGVLSFDVDLAIEAMGFRSRARLWMSVVPAMLDRVGRALADLPEVPSVAATTGWRHSPASALDPDNPAFARQLLGGPVPRCPHGTRAGCQPWPGTDQRRRALWFDRSGWKRGEDYAERRSGARGAITPLFCGFGTGP